MKISFLNSREIYEEKSNKMAKMTPLERFTNRIIEGLNKQIDIIDSEIEGIKPLNVKRWYQQKDKKYIVYIKFQNKPIPYLEGLNCGIYANDLYDVKKLYKEIIEEINSNSDFINHLYNLTKNMNIAKGRMSKI